MPVTFLDRIPLPNLKIYSALSVVLLSVSVYYAVNVTSDPGWKLNITQPEGEDGKVSVSPDIISEISSDADFSNDTRTFGRQMADAASFMMQEPLCIWTLINMSYCCLFMLGRSVQRVVFGELRVSEQQHVKDKFWNFVFYKFIFVFGVINVQYMDEVVLWVAWFTALGFLQLLTQLCKDRFEYLSFSASYGGWAGARLAALLAVILVLDVLLMVVCVAVAVLGGGLNTFAFMSAECFLLSLYTVHVIFRYGLHVLEARGGGTGGPGQELAEGTTGPAAARDRRAPLAHYAELAFELTALAVDLLHHVHMLVWSNIFLSMASLVICMQLRFLFHELQRRVRKHINYLWVLNHMKRNYPMATNDELTENSDNCAICWEKMDTARKLPCGHLFHNTCLSSWLQQDTSCPTCRLGLSLWPSRASQPPLQPRQPNHFFHFDGSRYVSWLPSFSVEVTHIMRPEPQATNSQMDAMARQVQQLFPHFPISVIMRDLVVTHSVELTVENILDGHLELPAHLVTLEPPEGQGGQSRPNTVTTLPGLPGLLLTQSRPASPGSMVLLQHSLSMLANQLNEQQDSHQEQRSEQTRNIEQTQQESSEDHAPSGGRFSKCSNERMRMLQMRKELLMNRARKKYLEKEMASKQEESHNPNVASEGSSTPSTSSHYTESPATKPNMDTLKDSNT